MDFLVSLSKDLIEDCEAQRRGASFSGASFYAFGHKSRLMVKEVKDVICRAEGTALKNSGSVEVYFTKS